jgi:hypothetical protein
LVYTASSNVYFTQTLNANVEITRALASSSILSHSKTRIKSIDKFSIGGAEGQLRGLTVQQGWLVHTGDVRVPNERENIK